MKKSLILIATVLGVIVVIASSCGTKTGTDRSVSTGKVIKAAPMEKLTATLSR